MNILKPNSIQRASLLALLSPGDPPSWRDAFIKSQTGSGKTLSYHLPILHDLLPLSTNSYIDRSIGTVTIIIAPARELAKQISDVLEVLLKLRLRPLDAAPDDEENNSTRFTRWLVSGQFTGGATRGHENARLRKGIPILVATPGRLLDDLQSTSPFGVIKCRWLVHDEADRLMELGFVDRIKGILACMEGSRKLAIQAVKGERSMEVREWDWSVRRHSILYSATMREDVQVLASTALQTPLIMKTTEVDLPGPASGATEGSAVSGGEPKFTPPRICYRNTSLCHSNYVWSHLLPYFNPYFRDLVAEGASKLLCSSVAPTRWISIGVYLEAPIWRMMVTAGHAGSVLPCTSVAARGLDLPLVRAVEQYDLSTEGGATEYIHRVGRTARAGRGRQAWTIIAPSEEQWVEWVHTRIASEAAEGGAGHFVAVAVEEILRAGFGGQGREYKDHATEVQLAFERWCLQRKENVEMARKAFASHLRAYATHPLDDKQMFHVRHLHLGHLAKSFCAALGP